MTASLLSNTLKYFISHAAKFCPLILRDLILFQVTPTTLKWRHKNKSSSIGHNVHVTKPTELFQNILWPTSLCQ